MGIELILARFGEDGDEVDQTKAVGRLAKSVRSTLRRLNCLDIDASVSGDTLLVDLPGGTVEIHADHAIFPIQELDPLTVEVVFAVAKAGDFAVLPEGGQYPAILFRPYQRRHLPEEDWKRKEVSPVCRSPDELAKRLESWFRANSEFRARAVKRFLAEEKKSGDDAARAAAPQRDEQAAAKGKKEEIEIEEVRYEAIHLYRFDAEANECPKHPAVMQDLSEVCLRYIGEHGGGAGRLVNDDEWPPLSLRLPDHSVDIWPGLAIFNIPDLRPAIAELMFRLARAGDFSVVVPGVVLLTDEGQRARLPKSWSKMKILSCGSPEKLRQQLDKLWMSIPEPDRKCPAECWIPGAFPGRARAIYIEATAKETPVQHQRKVYKHRPEGEGAPPPPKSGLMGADFWQLTTPAGQRFYAYSYGGEGWLPRLRHFAQSSNRALGFVVNFETFVQDDNRKFPLSACQVQEVQP
ncbi:MAG: hypothetical protein L0211_24385 [Planctomycetaceae bacterium]|nr:hypothetical protein [Planctomycetaceae bacterium]